MKHLDLVITLQHIRLHLAFEEWGEALKKLDEVYASFLDIPRSEWERWASELQIELPYFSEVWSRNYHPLFFSIFDSWVVEKDRKLPRIRYFRNIQSLKFEREIKFSDINTLITYPYTYRNLTSFIFPQQKSPAIHFLKLIGTPIFSNLIELDISRVEIEGTSHFWPLFFKRISAPRLIEVTCRPEQITSKIKQKLPKVYWNFV